MRSIRRILIFIAILILSLNAEARLPKSISPFTRDYGWQSSAWVKTNETRHVCDGLLPIQERDANSYPLVTYTRGLDLSGSIQGAGGIGGLLARTDATGSAFYHADGIGNITALMDGQGDIVARYLYNPFGKPIGKWGPFADANVMQFSSMPKHRELVRYPARDYSTDLQRFTTADPNGEAAGHNLFQAVANSPLNVIDPDGRDNMYNPGAGQNAPVNIGFEMPVGGGYVDSSYLGTDPLAYLAGDIALNYFSPYPLLMELGVVTDTSADSVDRWASGLRLGGSAILAGVGAYQLGRVPCLPKAAKGIPPVKVLPSSGTKFVVDPKGNVIPLKPGETLTGSPNGKWLQVRDANGNPTGMRLDGGHKPSTHPDPRAQVPHGHVPGVTNPDGSPWLPVNQ